MQLPHATAVHAVTLRQLLPGALEAVGGGCQVILALQLEVAPAGQPVQLPVLCHQTYSIRWPRSGGNSQHNGPHERCSSCTQKATS